MIRALLGLSLVLWAGLASAEIVPTSLFGETTVTYTQEIPSSGGTFSVDTGICYAATVTVADSSAASVTSIQTCRDPLGNCNAVATVTGARNPTALSVRHSQRYMRLDAVTPPTSTTATVTIECQRQAMLTGTDLTAAFEGLNLHELDAACKAGERGLGFDSTTRRYQATCARYNWSAHFGGVNSSGVGGILGVTDGYESATTPGGNSWRIVCEAAPDGYPEDIGGGTTGNVSALNARLEGEPAGTATLYEGACEGPNEFVHKYITADVMLAWDFTVDGGLIWAHEEPGYEATHLTTPGAGFIKDGTNGRDPAGDSSGGNGCPVLRAPYNTACARHIQMTRGVRLMGPGGQVNTDDEPIGLWLVDDGGQQEENCASDGNTCAFTTVVHEDANFTDAQSYAAKTILIGAGRRLDNHCEPVSATDPTCVARNDASADYAITSTSWGVHGFLYGQNPGYNTFDRRFCVYNGSGDGTEAYPTSDPILASGSGEVANMPFMACAGKPSIRATTSNNYCTASSTPYACCTGAGTGTCNARVTASTGGCDFGGTNDLGPALSFVDLIEYTIEGPDLDVTTRADNKPLEMSISYNVPSWGEGGLERRNDVNVWVTPQEVRGEPQDGVTRPDPTEGCGPINTELGRVIEFGDIDSQTLIQPFPQAVSAISTAVGDTYLNERFALRAEVIDPAISLNPNHGISGIGFRPQDYRGRITCPFGSSPISETLGEEVGAWCDSSQIISGAFGIGGHLRDSLGWRGSTEGHAWVNHVSEQFDFEIRRVEFRNARIWKSNLLSYRGGRLVDILLRSNQAPFDGTSAIVNACLGAGGSRRISFLNNTGQSIMSNALGYGCTNEDLYFAGNTGALLEMGDGGADLKFWNIKVDGHFGDLFVFDMAAEKPLKNVDVGWLTVRGWRGTDSQNDSFTAFYITDDDAVSDGDTPDIFDVHIHDVSIEVPHSMTPTGDYSDYDEEMGFALVGFDTSFSAADQDILNEFSFERVSIWEVGSMASAVGALRSATFAAASTYSACPGVGAGTEAHVTDGIIPSNGLCADSSGLLSGGGSDWIGCRCRADGDWDYFSVRGVAPVGLTATVNASNNTRIDFATSPQSMVGGGWQLHDRSFKFTADPPQCAAPITEFSTATRLILNDDYSDQSATTDACRTNADGSGTVEFVVHPRAKAFVAANAGSTTSGEGIAAADDLGNGVFSNLRFRPVYRYVEVNGEPIPDHPYKQMSAAQAGDCENLAHGTIVEIHNDSAVGACLDSGNDGILDGTGTSVSTCKCDPTGNSSSGDWNPL